MTPAVVVAAHGPASQVGSRRRSFAILSSSSGLGSLGALPIFLVGAVAVFMRAEMRVDQAGVGAAVALALAAIGTGALVGGRVADRWGPRATLAVVVPVMGVASIAVGVFAHRWWHVVVLVVLVGAAHGLSSPAEHLALMRGLPVRWHGLAFGLRGAVGPTSTLIAGIAVPLVALTIGWRWAFVLCGAAILALGTFVRLYPGAAARGHATASPSRRAAGALLALAFASGCGSAAGIALGTFLVDSLQSTGVPLGLAGLLLSLGSIAGIAARFGVGALADRRSLGLRTVSTMMGMGAIGHLVLAVGAPVWLLVLAAMLAFAAGWGWTGLLSLSVMRAWPQAAGWATGVLTAGLAIGGAMGPAVFGQLVVRTSYSVAWGVNAGLVLLAAVLTLAAEALRSSASRAAASGARVHRSAERRQGIDDASRRP